MAVEAVVSVVIHQLTNLVEAESKTFYKVRDKVREVLNKLSLLNQEEYQEHSNSDLQFLQKVYNAGNAIESFALAETYLRRRGFFKNHSCKLKSELNKILKEIERGEHGNPPPALGQQQGDDISAPNRENSIFMKEVGEKLVQLISNSKPRQIISIFGDLGKGKLGSVRNIYNKLRATKNFLCGALVPTTKTDWSVTDLMKAIAEQVDVEKTIDWKHIDEVDLRYELHRLLQDKTHLIVINDIKSRKLLDDLRGALPEAPIGSMVVIITPNEEAASFADASNRYNFKALDIEDGLKVFTKKAWGNRQSPFTHDNMEDLKKIISESCRGTFLGIELLAGLLSTRQEIYEEWSKVFKQRDFNIKSPSFDILIFCYNDVPMHLKPCLLYLALFPKGFEIPLRRLFWLWLAEGFVIPSGGIAPEDVVEGYLEELEKRNMVEITKWRSDDSSKKCRLIGDLHDMLLPRALKIGLFHLHQQSDEHSNTTAEHDFGILRVVEYANILNYPTSKAINQNIQSYISFKPQKKDTPAEEVGRFLKKIIGVRGYGSLKVLDLEGVYRPKLPENLANLFHLRYLGLRWTFLDTLPSSIGSLMYLETLDIKHTHITSIPSSIWNMKHLLHLCLNKARLDLSAQSTVHKSPSQIQTLLGLFVDEKIARKIVLTLKRMDNLRKLDITTESNTTTATPTTTTTTSHASSYEEIMSWISSLSSLQSLRLTSRDTMGPPSELIIKPLSSLKNLSQLYLLGHLREALSWYQIPPGLKVLTLSVSKLGEDPMPTLSQLPNLMVLRLLADSYVGEELCCPENGFPALQLLKLWNLNNLERLTVDQGTMQKLKIMDIRCCSELKELPLSLLHELQSFRVLILTNMPPLFVSRIKRTPKNKRPHVEINKVPTTGK